MRRIEYKLVVADPPWPFDDKLPGGRRGAEKHYEVMSISDIRGYMNDLVAKDVCIAEDAVLVLWRVAAMVPEAYSVVHTWGFHAKSELVWAKQTKSGKPHFGMGRYVRQSHESAIIATRGKGLGNVLNHSTRSVFEAPVGRHSEKPDAFYELVERLFAGPRLELFARRRRPGWTCIGDELEV